MFVHPPPTQTLCVCVGSCTEGALACFQLKAEAPSTKAPEVVVVVGLGGTITRTVSFLFWLSVIHHSHVSKAELIGKGSELSTSDGQRETEPVLRLAPRIPSTVGKHLDTKRNGRGWLEKSPRACLERRHGCAGNHTSLSAWL